MEKRLRNLRNQSLAVWKCCASFARTDWQLKDYPIDIREQEANLEKSSGRFKPSRFSAQIVNWWVICGTGDTAAEAVADLKKAFENQKQLAAREHKKLPRPGTHVPMEFASREQIERHPALADDFVHRVLDLEWAFISDESSLWEFHEEETNEILLAKIKEIYGVDVSDVESAKLCEIFDRIVRDDKFQRWK